ncbi:MAG TPA: nuclear transport factor 2 family protein [Chloroflexota bacterium]|nr:nuclear transport factor 2 family protein [Chloroflexota bacterium]
MPDIDDLKTTWARVKESISRGDGNQLDQLLARREAVRIIATDPQEWWDRWQFLAVVPGQVEGMGGPFEIRSEALEAYREGTVGWIADRLTAHLRDGSTIPFRATGVFHLEDGQWRIVQMHWSLGVTNEETLGVELPT